MGCAKQNKLVRLKDSCLNGTTFLSLCLIYQARDNFSIPIYSFSGVIWQPYDFCFIVCVNNESISKLCLSYTIKRHAISFLFVWPEKKRYYDIFYSSKETDALTDPMASADFLSWVMIKLTTFDHSILGRSSIWYCVIKLWPTYFELFQPSEVSSYGCKLSYVIHEFYL